MYLTDGGSPDSGYRSCSPKCGRSADDGKEIKPQKQIASNRKLGVDHDGKEQSNEGSAWQTGAAHNEENCSFVKLSRKKRLAKQCSTKQDEEDISPVLGIRILPAEQFPNETVSQYNSNCKDSSQHLSHQRQTVQPIKTSDASSDFVCRLCRATYDDCLSLAQHKCVRLVNVKYDCAECGKVFGCPANLASHRRWHRPQEMNKKSGPSKKRRKMDTDPERLSPFVNVNFPKVQHQVTTSPPASPLSVASDGKSDTEVHIGRIKAIYPCPACKRRFRRDINRKKHASVKHGIDLGSTESASKPSVGTNAQSIATHPISMTKEMPSPKCNLSTLAMAAEALDANRLSARNSPITQFEGKQTISNETTVNNDSETPLDLRTRPVSDQLNHSIAHLTRLGDEKVQKPSVRVHAAFVGLSGPTVQLDTSPKLTGHSIANYQALRSHEQLVPSIYAPGALGWSIPPYPYLHDNYSLVNMGRLLASIQYRM